MLVACHAPRTASRLSSGRNHAPPPTAPRLLPSDTVPLALAEYLSLRTGHTAAASSLYGSLTGFSQPGKPCVVPQILELSLNFLGCPKEWSLCPGMFHSKKTLCFFRENMRNTQFLQTFRCVQSKPITKFWPNSHQVSKVFWVKIIICQRNYFENQPQVFLSCYINVKKWDSEVFGASFKNRTARKCIFPDCIETANQRTSYASRIPFSQLMRILFSFCME